MHDSVLHMTKCPNEECKCTNCKCDPCDCTEDNPVVVRKRFLESLGEGSNGNGLD